MTERRRMRRTEKENGELDSLETVGSWKSCELFRDIFNVMVYFPFFFFAVFGPHLQCLGGTLSSVLRN